MNVTQHIHFAIIVLFITHTYPSNALSIICIPILYLGYLGISIMSNGSCQTLLVPGLLVVEAIVKQSVLDCWFPVVASIVSTLG